MLPLLAAALWLVGLASPASADMSPGRLEFAIERDGREEGRHVVEVRETSDGWSVQSNVHIDVKFGPIVVFRYRQSCSESWQASDAGPRLENLRCETSKGGRDTEVSARRDGATLLVSGAEGQARVAASAVPTNWWAHFALDRARFIDTETGEARDLRITPLGASDAATASGDIPASKTRVQGTIVADLWYDANGRWVGCTFTARGQTFTYRLISPLSTAPRAL